MFERFTDGARQAVVQAQREARLLQHNYIGTEHILLGLLREPGIAAEALERFGVTLDSVRSDVRAIIGAGQGKVSGHIPFTPRAKKTLELSLREARQLGSNFIGTQHILLGLMREGNGIAAQILRKHVPDLLEIRMAVLDDVAAATPAETTRGRGRLRRRSLSDLLEPPEADAPGDWPFRAEHAERAERAEHAELRTTPAADKGLNEAVRLAGSKPVGSHHLLLGAIGDPDTAAARALAAHGIDLDQVRTALQTADVAGTSDERPAEAGRRKMQIRVTGDRLVVDVTDPVIVGLGRSAVTALGDTDPPGTIRGDLPAAVALTGLWQALQESLAAIGRRASAEPGSVTDQGSSGEGSLQERSDDTGTGAA